MDKLPRQVIEVSLNSPIIIKPILIPQINMNKKALKSLEANLQKPKSQGKITFNKSSFTLGNILVITDSLNKSTRDIIIQEYKNNKFDPQIQKQPLINPLNNNKNYVILNQSHALEIIKDNLLKPLKKIEESFRITKISSLPQKNDKNSTNRIQQERPCFYTKIKQRFRSRKQSTLKINQNLISSEKQKGDETLKSLIETKCIKLDEQILIKSMVMIIEKQSQSENDDDSTQTKSIVVFEHPYPLKQFDKSELISMIGRSNYQQKLLAAVKIYHYSITNQQFSNPLFQTCHQCMKVKSNLEFPQNYLFCPKKLQSGENKYIISKFVYSPFSYMKRVIQRDHFNLEDQPFTHPYLQYHTNHFSDEVLSCNRRWCGFCVINGKKNMNTKQCQFCDFACKCLRCRKFEKLIKLLAHYFNYGGEQNQIRQKFLFSQIFDSQHFNYEPKQIKSTFFNKNFFPYIEELRKTYEIYQQFFHVTNQWDKLPNSRLISGAKPSAKKQYEMVQENWEVQKIHAKKHSNLFQANKQKKNKAKAHRSIKAQNIQAKINNLTEDTKKKFVETAKQQEKILAKELVRSGVIKSSNPLETQAFKINKDKEIILQQTELQKKENKFYLENYGKQWLNLILKPQQKIESQKLKTKRSIAIK